MNLVAGKTTYTCGFGDLRHHRFLYILKQSCGYYIPFFDNLTIIGDPNTDYVTDYNYTDNKRRHFPNTFKPIWIMNKASQIYE